MPISVSRDSIISLIVIGSRLFILTTERIFGMVYSSQSLCLIRRIKRKFEKLSMLPMESMAERVLKPAFEGIQEQLDRTATKVELRVVHEKVDSLDRKVENLDSTLRNQYPNKDYLDNKLADVVSEIGLKILKREEKEKDFKLYLINVLQSELHVSEPIVTRLRELAELK